MVRVMKAEIEHPQHQSRCCQHRSRCWLGYLLVAIVALTLLVGLLFPWGISAYYVELAGRKLDADEPTDVMHHAAKRQLGQALLWHPENAQAYRLLAWLYEQQSDWAAAAEAWAEYAALRPRDPQGFWELAVACERLRGSELLLVSGRPCGVDEEGRQAVLSWLWGQAGQSAGSFVRAGDNLYKNKDWSQAIAYYRRAVVLEPESAAAWYGLGEVYRMRNDTGAALEAYALVVAFGPDVPWAASAHSRRGKVLAGAQRWVEASEELAQAVSLMPDEGQYHLDYGWYLGKAGEYQKARVELTSAITLLPDNAWPHVRLAELDFAEKDYAGMLTHAQLAIGVDPELFWGWLFQSRALRYLNRLVEAEAAARRAVELVPDKGGPYAELGHALRRQNRLNEAIKEYKRAITLVPDNAWYHLYLGNAYRADGQVEQAIEEYRRTVELDPGNSAARQALEELEH